MSGAEVYRIIVPPGGAESVISFEKHPGITWRDYLIMLLHIASEVEHGLMVQYLYAAYSLGRPGMTPCEAKDAADWQRSILNVAKEEMGHLLTVQNVLALLGAPPNFNRAETPFDTALSPIPFILKPLTRDVVASFTFAEMSPEIDTLLRDNGELREGLKLFLDHHQRTMIAEETRLLAKSAGVYEVKPQPVALLYEEIIRVIGDEDRIPDRSFDESSYEAQASWDDWGRGYAPDPKLLTPAGDEVSGQQAKHRANVIVMRAATRTEALRALHAISGQGEAAHLKHSHRHKKAGGLSSAPRANHQSDDAISSTKEEPSHFERFLRIWQNYPESQAPCRNLMVNPCTRPSTAPGQNQIKDSWILDWAVLFNCRYRMLLTFLTHSYRLSRVTRQGEPNLRGMVMHRAFGEMYHIKTIAGLLVQMKVSTPDEPDCFAGPPFETPYSLNMPAAHVDSWHLHRELVQGSLQVIGRLKGSKNPLGRDYLQTLAELDHRTLSWIDGILNVPAARETA